MFARVGGAKNIGDGADILAGIDPLGAIGIEGADAGGQRAAVVQVEQHARTNRVVSTGPALRSGRSSANQYIAATLHSKCRSWLIYASALMSANNMGAGRSRTTSTPDFY